MSRAAATKSKSKKSPTRHIWDGDDSVMLNPNAPQVQNHEGRLKWSRRALYVIAFGMIPLVGVTALGYFTDTEREAVTNPSEYSLHVNGSLGKAEAIRAIESWLGTTPAPLPGSGAPLWDGYETLEKPAVEGNDKPLTWDVEVHHFTLTVGTGEERVDYNSTVEVLVDKTLGAKTNSTPTLIPKVPSEKTQWPGELTWPGYPETDAPASVREAIDGWAEAFMSGRPERLRLAVGDAEAKNTYLPLSGAAYYALVVDNSAYVPVAKDEKPDQMLVRVSISVAWNPADIPSDEAGANKVALPHITYDLLIDGADTAAPRVVSWGGPGSGPSLTPYSTAVTGVTIKTDTKEVTAPQVGVDDEPVAEDTTPVEPPAAPQEEPAPELRGTPEYGSDAP